MESLCNLGQVEHYFIRLEYQARGAGHYHCLLWVKDAPVVGMSSEENIAHFVTQYVTCELPDRISNPQLHELVTKWQLHRCGSYCMRKRLVQGNNGKKATLCKCQFSFPRPECDAFHLHDPAKAHARDRRLYDLPRTSDEIRVNDYNAALLLTWKANIDVSFVADAAHGLANYVAGYTTKGERSPAT